MATRTRYAPEEVSDDDDDAATVLTMRTAASVRGQLGLDDEQKELARQERFAAERASVQDALAFRPSNDEEKEQVDALRRAGRGVKMDARLGYVADLVSTLVVELEAFAEQGQAFGHPVMRRSLLVKMFYNTKEEWKAQVRASDERAHGHSHTRTSKQIPQASFLLHPLFLSSSATFSSSSSCCCCCP